MSEAAARFRQPIDLDEFEHRLRTGTLGATPVAALPAGAPAAKTEDPLAELARLVGQADPFRAGNAPPQLRPAAARNASAVRGPVPHLHQVHPPLDRADPPFDLPVPGKPEALTAPPLEPQLQAFEQPLSYEPVYVLDESAHLAGHDGAPQAARAVYAADEVSAAHPETVRAVPADVPSAAAIAAAHGEVPRRSWRGVIILSAVLATGFAGLAAAITMKGSFSGGSAGIVRNGNEPPVILAGGPTKVQPPKNAADVPDDQPSVLDKTASTKPSKAKLIDNAEQPVDLSQQPSGARSSAALNAAVTAPAATAPAVPDANITVKPSAPRQIASLDPVAAIPGPMGSRDGANAVARRAESDPPPSPGRNGFPEPRRVKVVSVRPDGSIIGGEAEAQPAAPQPAAQQPQSAAQQPEPAAEEPLRPVEMGVVMPNAGDPMAAQDPRSPVAEARTDAPVPSPRSERTNEDRRRDAVAALIDGSKGDRQASTKAPETPRAAETPKDGADAAAPKPARKKTGDVADLGTQDKSAAQDTAADEGGRFAAQLAASPTESAAKATLRKLKRKYGSTFGSHKLSYRRVKVDGKTVYRVRLTGLTKGDADTVCGKLQDDGGTCFVARN